VVRQIWGVSLPPDCFCRAIAFKTIDCRQVILIAIVVANLFSFPAQPVACGCNQ
jgi:hypothetical protein